MIEQSSDGERIRTAVLVVHGMGNQRPLETVRGVIGAVWRDPKAATDNERKIWTHPERSGTDIDLPVFTTSRVPGTADGRSVDFHELYWAHLMSETKAAAVLLWLIELGREGPHLRKGMRPLWWGGAVYLCYLILSVSLIVLQSIERLAQIESARPAMIVTPLLMIFLIAGLCWGWALIYNSDKLARWFGIATGFSAFLLALCHLAFRFNCPQILSALAVYLLPAGVAAVAVYLLMRTWGLWAFAIAYLSSFAFHALLVLIAGRSSDPIGFIPWSLTSNWSSAAAWGIIAAYIIINAAFLQPYLGDVASYFRNAPGNVAVRREIRRQAVATLEGLHLSGRYDRIVVVAHSLGTVVAYDMLRAYFGRVYRQMPTDPADLGPEFLQVNDKKPEPAELRAKAREIVRRMAQTVAAATARQKADAAGAAASAAAQPKAWLVSDFVTMGSPLTHAEYLLCRGDDEKAHRDDFKRRRREREFPTCPPFTVEGDGDGWLAFRKGDVYRFHHGALFGLTRWTNLYFPLEQLFWGDPIGGPVAPVFGSHIVDIPVSTHKNKSADLCTHTTYWDIERECKERAPHIRWLRRAINLEDGPAVTPEDVAKGLPETDDRAPAKPA